MLHLPTTPLSTFSSKYDYVQLHRSIRSVFSKTRWWVEWQWKKNNLVMNKHVTSRLQFHFWSYLVAAGRAQQAHHGVRLHPAAAVLSWGNPTRWTPWTSGSCCSCSQRWQTPQPDCHPANFPEYHTPGKRESQCPFSMMKWCGTFFNKQNKSHLWKTHLSS